MNIDQKIREIIAKQLDVDISLVQDDKHFVEDLDADSLDVVEIIICIEDEFHIEIEEDNAENIVTVGDAIRQLKAKIV